MIVEAVMLRRYSATITLGVCSKTLKDCETQLCLSGFVPLPAHKKDFQQTVGHTKKIKERINNMEVKPSPCFVCEQVKGSAHNAFVSKWNAGPHSGPTPWRNDDRKIVNAHYDLEDD